MLSTSPPRPRATGRRAPRAELIDLGVSRAQLAYRRVVLTSFQEVEDNMGALRVLASEARVQQAAVADSQHALDLAMTS